MHPAPSIIFFTVLSGLGFALLGWFGICPPEGGFWKVFAQFGLGFSLAVIGLLFSTLHLGNPQRALLAFTQWRTSWLSREACLAVFALFTSALYGAGILFFDLHLSLIGWLSTAFAGAVIFSTAMIYAQLKTVPAWNTTLVPALFLTYAFAGGAVLAGATFLAIAGLIVLGFLQLIYWIWAKGAFENRGHRIETATALGSFGAVRQLEPPHTGENYLLKEMVFSVARSHRKKLYRIAAIFLVPVPLFFLLWVCSGELNLIFGHGLAVLSYLLGALSARWLFFAEARHVVGLYYDQKA